MTKLAPAVPAILAVLLGGAVAAGSATAATPRLIGSSEFALTTDGSRYAVAKTSDNALTVRDDLRGRRFEIPVEPGCYPADVASGGLTLVGCPGEDGQYRFSVLDVDDQSRTVVPSFNPAFEGYSRIGRQWLQGGDFGSGHSVITYLNWHTGERRTSGEESGGPYTPRDLDKPGLPALTIKRPGDFTFATDSPFALTQTARNDREHPARITLFRNFGRHTLGKRVALLDPCPNACGALSLGAGLATWSHGRYARAYVIKSGRRLGWRFPKALLPPDNPTGQVVQHTRTTVYTSLFDQKTGRVRLYAARWK